MEQGCLHGDASKPIPQIVGSWVSVGQPIQGEHELDLAPVAFAALWGAVVQRAEKGGPFLEAFWGLARVTRLLAGFQSLLYPPLVGRFLERRIQDPRFWVMGPVPWVRLRRNPPLVTKLVTWALEVRKFGRKFGLPGTPVGSVIRRRR